MVKKKLLLLRGEKCQIYFNLIDRGEKKIKKIERNYTS